MNILIIIYLLNILIKEVLFHYGGAPIGAFVSNYLLEKPRISGMGQGGERNFHVFYQVRRNGAAGDTYQYTI